MDDRLHKLEQDLQAGAEEKQIKALEVIAYELAPQEAEPLVPTIRRLTSDPNPALRYYSRLALDQLGLRSGREAEPLVDGEAEIATLLTAPDSDLRLRGVLSAYRVQSPLLFQTLTDVLRHESDPWVRASLVKALARYRRPVSLPLLMKFLADDDGRVRANTVEALAELENPVVLSRLAEMIDDPEHRVQSAVLAALGRAGNGDIRPRIRSMLLSGQIWLQASAVYLIQTLSPDWGLELLEEAHSLGLADRRLRSRVENLIGVFLRRSAGQTLPPDPPELPDDGSEVTCPPTVIGKASNG
jgi:hypothetical protein